jgi:hypothetical protein
MFCVSRKGVLTPCDFVLVGEDGEQEAVHAGVVLESAHRLGADFAEARLDGVGGAHVCRSVSVL